MLQLKRKSLRLPDGLLIKVYKDIVKGYHNENRCFNIDFIPHCNKFEVKGAHGRNKPNAEQ